MSYASVVLGHGPIAYWHLDETAGALTATDATGNGHSGTVNGPTFGVAAHANLGTAASFDGTNDLITLDNIGSFGASIRTATIELWIKTTTTARGVVLASFNGNAGSDPVLRLRLNTAVTDTSTQRSTELWVRGTSGEGRWSFNNATMYDGSWHHLVWTLNGSTVIAYLDGTAQTLSSAGSVPTTGGNYTNNVRLGAVRVPAGTIADYANCQLDEVALYTKALTAQQVSDHLAVANGATLAPNRALRTAAGALRTAEGFAVGRVHAAHTPTVPPAGVTMLSAMTDVGELATFLSASGQSRVATWGTFIPDNGTFASAIAASNTIGSSLLELAWSQPGSTNLAGIAAGNDDAYITARALELLAYNRPVYLRWNWEMNGDWYAYSAFDTNGTPRTGNSPADYIAAWRRVVGIVRSIAPNAAFVWCPHLWEFHSTPAATWYPGDSYVDWIGVTAYPGSADWAYILTGADWGLNQVAAFAVSHAKPMRICEWGAGQGGSGSNVGLFYQFKEFLEANTVVREILYFNLTGGNGVNYRLNLYADWVYAYKTQFTANAARWRQR